MLCRIEKKRVHCVGVSDGMLFPILGQKNIGRILGVCDDAGGRFYGAVVNW